MKDYVNIPVPIFRRLRAIAFDPSLAILTETAEINELTLEIPWESGLKKGPIGEYIEVIDYDPASEVFYEPVDLDSAHLIATDGLTPSESDPQFHQQMVYAVSMAIIGQFERALGRVALWSDYVEKLPNGDYVHQFVRRLRIYPHALREKNAYYSPGKKALLFGYFPVTRKDARNTPGTLVFTCLSHDIIAHEITHALLDGVHPRFNEPTNVDVHAFHEAFADIVSLFQHFTYAKVLKSQISKTRGDLKTENLLGQLAQEFGRAMGRGGALRDALGAVDPDTGLWEPRHPDPHALDDVVKPHSRGAILVAAVFRAFILMYTRKSQDLFRIATQGTGVLPQGDIHPDLTNRLAAEARDCADRVLQMCIRSIDYFPPMDITFGDFLRAIVTADLDFSPQDDSYRIVFIQSFREWGIQPMGVLSMGIDSLKWPSADELIRNTISMQYASGGSSVSDKEKKSNEKSQRMKKHLADKFEDYIKKWNLESDRFELWSTLISLRKVTQVWVTSGNVEDYEELFGLAIRPQQGLHTVYGRYSSRKDETKPYVEVHSVRPVQRKTISGSTRTDMVIEITQRRRGYFDLEEQARKDREGVEKDEDGDFIYRAGCTIILDVVTQEIRRVIRTPGRIDSDEHLDRLRRYFRGDFGITGNAFHAGLTNNAYSNNAIKRDEPFALLHSPT